MQHRIAVCLGSMALCVATATSAQAQGYYYGPPRVYVAPMHDSGLPPGEVLMAVRAAGLSPLTQPARRGARYVVLASDRMGGQLRVVVDAYSGRIVRVAPAHDPRFDYHPARPPALVPVPSDRYGAPPPMSPHYRDAPPGELKDPPRSSRANPPPATTGSIPDSRLAASPPASDPVPPRPARTPLPRPRPTIASSNATPPAPEAPAQPPASAPPAAAATPAAKPATETQMVPVAPLD